VATGQPFLETCVYDCEGTLQFWRVLAFFDSIPRFNEVKGLLRNKYGARFKSLRPTDDSLEWLCGDNAGKLDGLSYG
jgi:hypothetical protein